MLGDGRNESDSQTYFDRPCFLEKKNKTKLIFSKINKFRDSPSYYLIIRYSIVRTNYRAYFSII